jgi:hypothetical protein
MKPRSHTLVRLALLLGAAAALGGCDSIRDATGVTKDSPDEFAVATKAPLIIPPDFNLRPPRAGAAPTNQVAPTQAAHAALFSNSDPATVASNMSGNASQGEKLLLAYAGAADADNSIRQQLASDSNAMQGSDDSFTNQVLFWQKPETDAGQTVDGDAEARRIDAQKTTGQAAAKPSDAKTPDTTAPKEEKSGWLDGIF